MFPHMSKRPIPDAVTDQISHVAKTIRGFGQSLLSHGSETLSSTLPTIFPKPGGSPGIEQYLEAEEEQGKPESRITCVDYGPGYLNTMQVHDLDAFLETPRPTNIHVRWLNIDGLSAHVVEKLRKHFGMHILAAEDVLNVYQRPKIEDYNENIFVVARQISHKNRKLFNEQLSCFLLKDTLITFQEEQGDLFDPVRKRLERDNSRFRHGQADYLLYALLDCIVDNLFPLCERYGHTMEALERVITKNPQPSAQHRLFAIKRDLSSLRRQVWPMREMLQRLERDECDLIGDSTRTYLRDVYDHCLQVLEVIETYRETASGLNDLYQSSVGNKMNEIMKVLTIMASFFIPITFVAGVYGMNFEYIPELGFKYSYFIFWGICASIIFIMGVFFWRKGWLGPTR